MKSSLYYFAMGLTVVANVGYHFCQKGISPNANPLVSLFFTYLTGMLITLVCIPFFYPGLQIGSSVKGLNWATFALGFGIVGLELGFLLAYRAGWNLSLGAALLQRDGHGATLANWRLSLQRDADGAALGGPRVGPRWAHFTREKIERSAEYWSGF